MLETRGGASRRGAWLCRGEVHTILRDMRIALASDHAGFDYKQAIHNWLRTHGHDVKDFGTFSSDSVDYPDFIRPAAEAVARGEGNGGIVLGAPATAKPSWPTKSAASAAACAGMKNPRVSTASTTTPTSSPSASA